MSVTDKIESLEPLLLKFRRALVEAEVDVNVALATAAPLVRLGMQLPLLVDHIHAYRAARTAVMELGGDIMRDAYELHLQVLLEKTKTLGTNVKAPLLQELRAWDRYITDLAQLRALTAVPAVRGGIVLSAEHQEVIGAVLRRVQGVEGTFDAGARANWRQYLRAVGVHQDEIWQPSLKRAQRLAEELAAWYGSAARSHRWWEIRRFQGHLNTLQGGLFEPYARSMLQTIGETDHAMRVAGVRAGHYGSTWVPHHVNSEMFMSSMSRQAFEDIVAAGRTGPVELPWKQFADDGVLAVNIPRWTGDAIGEAEAAALMEFKVEEKSTLARKLMDFHRRHTAAAADSVVLVKFQGPIKEGRRADIICGLRPPASDANTAYYAVGTIDSVVPRAAQLNALGIDQRSVPLPMSRAAMRQDLSVNLVHTILETLLK
jgi:hypothetical protein